MKSSTNRALVAKKQSTSFAQVANNLLNLLQGYTKSIRLLLVMFMTLSVSVSVWGADYSKNEVWNFSTTGNSYWSGHNSGYCGACGNKNAAFNVYKTNITNFSNIDFSKYENVSLTIYVKAGTNSGTNSYTVKLIDANGNQVSTYTSTKTSSMGNGTSSSAAKESSVSFNPTTSFNGYKIEFPAKAYITQTRYVLTYDDKAASCDKKVTVNKGGPSNGSFSIIKPGTYETCAAPLVITLSNITPIAGYQFGEITQTGIGTGVTIDQANKTVTYAKNISGTSTINVTFEQKQSATITLSEAGVETSVAGKYVGDSYKLPSTTSQSCGDLEFVGWSTVEINNSASKPASNYYAKGESVTLAANQIFYAVFATATGGGDTSKQYSFDITKGNFNSTSYAANNNSKTSTAKASDNSTKSVSWTSNQVMQQSSTMQWQSSKGCIYNTTNLGNITNITITSTAGTFTTYYGTSQQPSQNTSVGTGNGYFQIKVGSTTGKVSNIKVTFTQTVEGETTTYSDYTTTCTTEPSQLATPTGLNVTNITSTSATLSWGAVTNASGYKVTVVDGNSYNKTISVEKNNTSITLDDLTQLTAYSWTVIAIGDGTNYTNSDESETSEFTTQKACTDAVNVIKGIPQNGSFSMVSGFQSTCNGPVTVTLSNIEPAAGYQFSAITQSGVDAAKVTIDNTAKTVTYAQNTSGNSTINVTFTPAVYTITYKDQGNATFSGTHESGNPTQHTYGTETTLKGATKTGYTFGGWYKEAICTNKVTSLGATEYTANITLYAQWTAETYTITLNANGGKFVKDGNESETIEIQYVYGTYANYDQAKLISDYLAEEGIKLSREGYQLNEMWQSNGSAWKRVFTAIDRTIIAQWSKLYRITLSENGTTKELDAQTSTSYTLPTELTAGGSCQDDTKELVGWSTVAIPNPGDKPTTQFYELGATVTLTKDQTTFYAVFATVAGGGVENVDATLSFESKDQRTTYTTSQQVWKQNGITLTNDKASSTSNVADYANPARFYKSSDITIEAPGNITQIEFNCVSDYVISVTGATTSGTTVTVTLDGTSDTYTIKSLSAQVRLNSLVVTYTTSGGTSYSDYTTVCEAIPDPVWGGAVIKRNSIKVDCGSMTKLNAADPNGPATISFPAATNHTLTYDITVTASEGFRVSTNKTDAAKYGASVTVSPNKTGDNAGKITQNVYVVAVAPAMSDEDFTGTITLSGKQLAENQVIDVTADVTCTQYTLTLVDRGVSTEQLTKYYAGATINEAPADPEGVCTDPIHYVFDGWAEAKVDEGSTTYTKVNFPYEVEGNTKFYAVYRYVEEGSAISGDYEKVTENLDDYSGDYLFVYETGNVAFDGGLDELDETSNTISVTINSNTIESNATTDAAKFTIAKVDGGYSIQSASGYYIGWSTADDNGLNANSKYSANYYLNTISNSIISGVKGTLKYNKTSGQERFRYYKSGQEPIALYRKAASYLYTTSPVCGPHLVITDGKEIYVTGGNAQAARDLVMAQQKVSYKAIRLNTKDGSAGGTAPDVVVADNGITKNGIVTSEVKVTFENTIKEQQADGSYTITGDIVVTYEAEANNLQEDIQVQLAVDYNSEASDNFTVHARSLPEKFVIVAKSGNKWYALNADMSSSKAQPANGQVKLNDPDNPTEATYAPCNAIYTFEAMPQGAEDRISVRFIGMENKYLWAASEGNNGVQNYSKAPAADALAYNWKLYTEDNITYHFGNAQNTRMLGLHSTNVAFGMYANGASVVQDIRILPYVEKCIYNYAPTNLKVSVLKGTYVTLTWDAVAGATKYQYSTDATSWTDCGTEPTVTINGLTGATKYTYYIRAYHEDAGVSQECIDYAKITFTTANCDDVPTNITYTADLNSITVSWTAAAPTATITYNTKEDGTGGGGTIENATSPRRISGGLNPNTTYYIQILADGTCASPIIPVKTEDVEVDIVEWMPDGIIVDINTDETVGVTLENEVAFGTGVGKKAEDIFFSKYFEANGTAKILAIYNGTDEKIDLSTVSILNDLSGQSLDLAEFGHKEVGYIYPNEEIILFSKGVEAVTECSEQQDSYPDWYNVEHGVLDFGGRATLILKRGNAVIDIIGSVETQGTNYPNDLVGTTIYNIAKFSTGENEKPSWGDDPGWVCESGDNIMTDVEENDYPLSTNRCLLVRKNTVISGVNAVAKNINKVFATLCDEWVGLQIPKNAPSTDKGVTESCEGMAFVGDFDYSDYYTKYVPMGEGTTFDKNARNADGTVTIPITDLYKHSCSNIRVKLTKENGDVLSDREYKVPIMITTTQGTDGQAFIDLRQNLATKEVDGEGNVIATHPLSLEDVREICKTCDIVVRDNATLTKVTDGATDDHPQVRNVYVYENSSLIVPNGTNYTINNLSLRRKGDKVSSLSAYPDALKLPESAAAPISLDFRLSAENWHWFTLPYNCNINEVTWADGTPAQYNTDWYLMTYDGEKRAETQAGGCWKAYTGTTINAGDGFIIAINGNINNPAHTYELHFPMSKEVLAAEGIDKIVAVRAWGVETNIRPNHKGWNLVGNPYLAYYQRNNITNFEGLRLGQLTGPDPQTGYWEQTGDVPYVVVPVGAGWIAYEQVLASETDLLPFTAYFVQVGNDGKHDSSDELSISFDHTKLQLSATPMPASIVRRAPSEVNETEEPVIVGVALTNSLGESDKTSLVIADRFTNEYEMQADFFKWFGDYYNYYTKPVLYTIGADQGKRAFNALNEELAAQPIPMGMYAAQAGNYTFSLNQQFDLSRVEEVWLYDATQSTYTNLMQSDYTFSTSKVNGVGRFSLSVKLAPKVATSIDNVTADKVWATTHTKQVIVNGLESGMHLWLYDATGKLLYNEPTSNYQHTYSVPQTGTYFVSVMKGNQKQTIKVVVE